MRRNENREKRKKKKTKRRKDGRRDRPGKIASVIPRFVPKYLRGVPVSHHRARARLTPSIWFLRRYIVPYSRSVLWYPYPPPPRTFIVVVPPPR